MLSGIGLRELARRAPCWLGPSANDGRRRFRLRKTQARVVQSNAITMQQRGERYTERMAGVREKVLPHLESMVPAEILERAREIELNDRWSRRNFGLDNRPPSGGMLNLAVLTNQAAVMVVSNPA
jgi:hypothetical protein